MQYKLKFTYLQGFGLIEVMIAATILALSLLGLASIQSRSLQLTRESGNRETAIRLLSQMSGFLVAMNPDEIESLFASTSISNCIGNFCNRNVFFRAILQNWRNNLNQSLPGGQGCLCVVPNSGQNGAITVRIAARWTSLSGALFTESLDNQVLSNTFTSSVTCSEQIATTNNRCPNFT